MEFITKEQEAANTAPLDEAQTVVETQATDVSIYDIIKDKTGQDITEDYLLGGYDAKYNEINNKYESLQAEVAHLKEKEELFSNQQAIQVAELLQKGLSPQQILESMSIDVASIDDDTLIEQYAKSSNSYIPAEDIHTLLKIDYGVGEDLEDIKEFDFERYKNILKNRHNAIEVQKQHLEAQKVALVTPPQVKEQEQQPLFDSDMLEKSQKDTQNTINNRKKIDIFGNISIEPTDHDAVASNIAFSGVMGETNMVVLKDISVEDVGKALFLLKNIGSIGTKVDEVVKAMSNEAFTKLQATFSNTKLPDAGEGSTGFRFINK